MSFPELFYEQQTGKGSKYSNQDQSTLRFIAFYNTAR